MLSIELASNLISVSKTYTRTSINLRFAGRTLSFKAVKTF